MPQNIENHKARLCTQRKIFGILLFAGFMATILWLVIEQNHISPAEFKRYQHQRFYMGLRAEGQLLKNRLQALLKCQDGSLTTELEQHGNYWVLKNVIRGRRSMDTGCAESITFTSFGDFTHFRFLEDLVTRWLGPISWALYAPGTDFAITMESIQYARHCSPVSRLIRQYVSFHIYFPNDHMPPVQIPRTEKEALNWPYNCFRMYAPYENLQRFKMYSTVKNLSFPINVGRNVAKKSVNTYFVLACDISVYPSLGFVNQFLQMAVNNIDIFRGDKSPRVFTLPVFELERNAIVPDNKDQLQTMLELKMAKPLYEEICRYCYAVPDQKRWLETSDSAKLEVISVVNRYSSIPYWDPYYVSDNREPEYDERLSWDDPLNKRLQNYAMCLMDYEYYILHPAFLIYAPGIRTFDSREIEYMLGRVLPEYMLLYGNNTNCTV